MAGVSQLFDVADVTKPGHYNASQTALLLLDFHTMFIQKAGGAEAPAATAVAVQLRKWAISQGIHVIHNLIDLDAKPFPTCKDYDRFASIVARLKADNDTEPTELHEGEGDDFVCYKQPGHVSALKTPGLEEYLQQRGIKSLIISGLSTSGCVMRTAIAACDAEYVVTVISDACGDPGEGVHDFVVGKLLTNRGYVATFAEFQNGFEDAQKQTLSQ